MNVSGFPAIYPILMSMTIFAGSIEFVAVNLLLGSFNPLNALFLAIMVNARHLFYGISMLEKYKDTGIKKLYLIFGLCDESFSINVATDAPEDVDKGLEFVMTALLVVLFLNQWDKEKQHYSSLIGISAAILCLVLFGSSEFLLPTMILILGILTLFRAPIEKAGETS